MAIVKTPYLIDNFTGVAGTNLESHTPDLGGTWVLDTAGTLHFKLDGSNQLTRDLSPPIPPGPASPIQYHMNVSPGTKWQYLTFKSVFLTYAGSTVYLCYKSTAPTYAVFFIFVPPSQVTVTEFGSAVGYGLNQAVTGLTFNNNDVWECRVDDDGAFGLVSVIQNGNTVFTGSLQFTGANGDRFSIQNTDDRVNPFIWDNLEVGNLTDQVNNWTTTQTLSADSISTQPAIKLSDGSILIGKAHGHLGSYTPFVYRSTDNGDTWTPVLQQSDGLAATPPTTSDYILAVQGFLEVGSGVVLAHGTTNGTIAGSGATKTIELYSVWRSADYGATWVPVVGVRGLSETWGSIKANDNSIVITGMSDRDAIYGTSAYPSILRSTDNGLTWTPVLTGALNDYTQSTATSTTQYIWKTNTGRLLTSKYDAAFDNFIMKSDDNGASWALAQNLGATDTYNIITNSTPMLLSELNQLRQSVDNGDTWTVYAYQPTFTGDLFYSAGTLFVVNYNIERSTGGAFSTVYNVTGTNITGMTKIGTEWYAYGFHSTDPAIIFLSTDDGLTWAVDETDIKLTDYNAVKNIIDLNGRALATGGSTTGAGTYNNRLAWVKTISPASTGRTDILRSAIFYNQLLRNRIVR